MYSTGNKTVDAIDAITFKGNVTPNLWYKSILFDSGKADLVAITLLSEFVYWYRAIEERDEQTGHTVGKKKRFKGDLLQRSYPAMAEKFGITKRQAQDACKRLDDMNLITRVLKNLTVDGMKVNNVLHIDLNPENIRRLTVGEPLIPKDDEANVTPITLERDTPHVETGEGPRSDGGGHTLKRDTNTKSTTKSTTENKKKNNKKEIPYGEIVDYLNVKTGDEYLHTDSDIRGNIRGRMKDGYTLDDFKLVIDWKIQDWTGTEWAKYIRPSTLFAKKHFANYVAEGKKHFNKGGANEINTGNSTDKYDLE